jgi:SAM-dependent methyltransferase
MTQLHRNTCIISETDSIKEIYTFKNFPISMSCVDTDPTEDIFRDMEWGCSSSDHIQLINLLDPDLIYKNYHNPGTVGEVWKNHHRMLAEFIQRDKFNSALEIGGASGSLVNNMPKDKDFSWTIVEPSTQANLDDSRLTLINGYFENYEFDSKFDIIVHSHCFEHVYNPMEFLRKVNSLLEFGGIQYISIPNMKYWLEQGFTNTLCFEHTFYVDLQVLTHLLSKSGFEVVDAVEGEHSIFVKAVKQDNVAVRNFDFAYVRDLFQTHIVNLEKDTALIKEQIGNRRVYLFGGHVFSQFLISLGIDEQQVICILDNDPKKHGKRLYGTNCNIKSPECLRGEDSPIIVLRGGAYTKEIKEKILQINPSAKVI